MRRAQRKTVNLLVRWLVQTTLAVMADSGVLLFYTPVRSLYATFFIEVPFYFIDNTAKIRYNFSGIMKIIISDQEELNIGTFSTF